MPKRSQVDKPQKISSSPKSRPARADAKRNVEILLNAAKEIFATSGVDAPVREIAEKAGVGLGTIYRHFPQRSDLIAAVFKHEVDDCAMAAESLSAKYEPADALGKWLERFADFVATKRGLAPSLRSDDPSYMSLRDYFEDNLQPAIIKLLDAAIAAGQIRSDVTADDLMYAVAHLSTPRFAGAVNNCHHMVSILVDGLRYGAKQ